MPDYIAVRCCSCSCYQSIQLPRLQGKKTPARKFACRLCQQKQSVIKIVARSNDASDIRGVVQSLNDQRRQQDEHHQNQHHHERIQRSAARRDGDDDDDDYEDDRYSLDGEDGTSDAEADAVFGVRSSAVKRRRHTKLSDEDQDEDACDGDRCERADVRSSPLPPPPSLHTVHRSTSPSIVSVDGSRRRCTDAIGEVAPPPIVGAGEDRTERRPAPCTISIAELDAILEQTERVIHSVSPSLLVVSEQR